MRSWWSCERLSRKCVRKKNSPVPVCTFMWLARLKTGEAWERGKLAFSYLSRETNYIKPLSLLSSWDGPNPREYPLTIYPERRAKPECTSSCNLSRDEPNLSVALYLKLIDMAALAKKGTLCISAEWKSGCVGIYCYAEIQVLMVCMKSFCTFTDIHVDIFRVMIELL